VVGNERPVADAGSDSLWPVPGRIVLDGLGSRDADPPDELTYAWTQVEGPNVTLLNPESSTPFFLCTEPAIYAFELIVSDGFVDSQADRVTLEASPFTLDSRPIRVADRGDANRDFYYPAIAGTTVAYVTEDWQTGTYAIECTEIESGRVDIFDAGLLDAMPKVDGRRVVWSSAPGRMYDLVTTSVMLGDLATGEMQFLRMGTSSESYGYPAISGNRIVWLRHFGVSTSDTAQYLQTPFDVCGADITDPAHPVFFTIAERAGRGAPYPSDNYYQDNDDVLDISGDIVVWEADGDIYGADISDLADIRVFPICTAAERQHDPSVSGNLVVWADERNDIGDIYGADISDPDHVREFEVWVGPGWQLQADIDGSLIAFVDGDEYSGYIRTCCVTREYGIMRFTLPEVQPQPEEYYFWFYGAGPEVDGSTIAWKYYDAVWAVTVELGYPVTAGPIENRTSGRRYDYIQHAIDAATDGDVIVVPPGTRGEKVRFNGRKVVVQSADPDDPTVRAGTILAGPGQRVTFADDETADSVLAGFTVAGGSYGVYCSGSMATIDNCTIVNNNSAGVKLWNKANPTFSHCEISGGCLGVDMWTYGGQRMILRNSGTFRNCLIVGNREEGIRGGLPTVENCTIADNLGYGIDAYLGSVVNSIVCFNNRDGEQIHLSSPQSTVTYSDVQGGGTGQGNIDADPLFVARGTWTADRSWLLGDYHLRSEGWSWSPQHGLYVWDEATSPCIDAGDPAMSIGQEPLAEVGSALGERAAVNQRINLGAYGGTAEASLAPHGGTP